MAAETDIIALCRRLIRSQQKHCVLNIVLDGNDGPLDPHQARILVNVVEDLLPAGSNQVLQMANGDMFCVLRADTPRLVDQVATRLEEALAPDHGLSGAERQLEASVVRYRVPEDYAALRERTNFYLSWGEGAGDGLAAAEAQPLRGPLCVRLLARMEDLLARIDVGPFLRQQRVHQLRPGGTLEPIYTELFTSLTQIRSQVFPDVQFDQRSPLISALLYLLDTRVLEHLARGSMTTEGDISVNLTMQALCDPTFPLFLSRGQTRLPGRLWVEIAHGDIFADLSHARRIIRLLRDHDVGVVVDGLTLEALCFLRVQDLPVDYAKLSINASELGYLSTKACVAEMKALGPTRLIIHRCDTQKALAIGRAFGVSRFQGWLPDEVASGRADPEVQALLASAPVTV